MGDAKKNYQSIDLIRSLAIGCVLLVHAVEASFPMYADEIMNYNMGSMGKILTFFTLGRIGVPLFLFISGYLLLDREYDQKTTIQFWKKNLLGLLVTSEIWIWIYNIYISLWYGVQFSFLEWLKNALFVKVISAEYLPHCWYIPMIIGLYLFLPLVSNMLKKLPTKITIIPIIIASLYFFVVPMVNVLLIATGNETVAIYTSVEFSGGCYGLCLIYGYYLKKIQCTKQSRIWWILLALISLAMTVGLQLFSYKNGVKYYVWYDCGWLVACAFSIFVVLKDLKNVILAKCWKAISSCSFGIYLVHVLIVKALVQNVSGEIDSSVRMIIMFAVPFIGSFLIVWLIKRIPVVGKMLFLK